MSWQPALRCTSSTSCCGKVQDSLWSPCSLNSQQLTKTVLLRCAPNTTSILSCKSFYRKHGGDGSSTKCAKSTEWDRQQSLAAETEWQLSSTDSCATEQLYLGTTLNTPLRQGPWKGGLKIASLKPSPQQETASVRTFLLLLWRILYFWNRMGPSFSYRFGKPAY